MRIKIRHNYLIAEAVVIQAQQISTRYKHGSEDIIPPMSMKITVVCNVPPCRLLGVY